MRNAALKDVQLPGESAMLTGVMEEFQGVRSSDDFLRVTGGSLQHVLPHEMMFSAIGTLTENEPRALDFLSHNFPLDFVTETQGPKGEIACRLLDYWLATEEPQLFQPGADAHRVSKHWLASFRKHDLRNIASYGIKGRSKSELSTYFTFARVQGPLGPRHARVLKLLGPHIHLAMTRVFSEWMKKDGPTIVAEGPLSERQREILRWIREGKTNWEISQIMSLTEKAVKYHVTKIFLKLEVTNRTQAVAKAVAMRLVQ